MKNTQKSVVERTRWWEESRFGMFIHWGLYTIDGLDCWKMYDMGIPVEEYVARYERRFRPKKLYADGLAAVAKNAGCKYVVMGTRHHEGYCLWNTKTTRFAAPQMTPGRDLIAEYVRAVRAAGLRVGFYYSLLDWRFKSYWDGPRKDPEGWRKMVDYVHAQVRELMTNYGKIDILWYDGSWPSGCWDFKNDWNDRTVFWRSKELNAMVRKLQPDIIINNRSNFPEDFDTPEQTIAASSRPWELCDTMGELWGAAPQDLNRKTVREHITRLIACVAQNGNMLINIGPKADGSPQSWQVAIMMRIGGWLKKHGEAIYGCKGERQEPFSHSLSPWRTTREGNVLYLHLLHYPGRSFGIANLHDYWLESARVLTTGARLKITHEPTRDIISGLPAKSADSICTVVKIKIRPKTAQEQKAKWTIGLVDPEKMFSAKKI